MHFFRYAQDYYGDWLAVQLLPEAAKLIVLLVAVFIGVHLLRRSFGDPLPEATEPQIPDSGTVEKFKIGARLYHWGNFIFLAALAVSGWALFVPRSLKPPMSTWLLIHEIFSGLFIAGVAVHIISATTRGEARSMWFEGQDWKDLRLIASNFFGKTRQYPRFGKYDVFQKLYHGFIAILSALMIFSGVFMVLSAESWATYSHEWMRWQRLVHDVGAFVFIAIILGHIYFGILRANWPELIAMVSGKISAKRFALKHSPSRWQPKQRTEDERK